MFYKIIEHHENNRKTGFRSSLWGSSIGNTLVTNPHLNQMFVVCFSNTKCIIKINNDKH